MIYTIARTIVKKSSSICMLFCCCILILSPSLSIGAETTSSSDAATEKPSQRFITIDFDNVDIRLFIKYISELTGKNFIIDRTVKGTVSIISPTKISEKEAYRVFESVLSVNGYTTIQSGAMIKIMPTVRARTENIDTLHHGQTSDPEDRIVTQLIPLIHTTPAEMKKVLAPLISKTSVVIAHTQSGMLIITDTLSNIQKLLSIIDSLDVDYSSDEMEVITLEYATASTLATTINAIFRRSTAPKKGAIQSGGIKLVPYDRINAVILLAGPGDILRVGRLIAMLDTEPEKDEGNIQVVYLQHARAKELAAVLNALPGLQQSAAKGPQKTPSISKNVKIMPDEETNALIITATRDEYVVLENIIKKLDIPRRMVYLEALILEVDMDSQFDVGVKWIGAGSYNDNTGAVLGGWGGEQGFAMGDAVGSDPNAAVAQGFALGVIKQGIEIGGITFPNIAAVLKAYKSDSSINVIATPQILTTDNKKAEINVGENVPYIESQNTT
ncbi:MAG: type II secretion system protein GspD, partial [Desulfocapsa sp.]|nr:type II secretion system protein GspD [Desulfocapsa sp.]